MTATTNQTDTSDREIIATRVLNAPRDLVFKMWTDPKHIAQWWGPKGFTNTIYEMDVRPGGVWRFTMHGPDGVDYPNHNVFVEVVTPERLVFDHIAVPKFHVTVTFAEQDGKTRLTMRMLFDSVAEYDLVKGYAVEGNKQTLDRLEAILAQVA
jgi:uncharacterized protein YndB with AHSA1/START domain